MTPQCPLRSLARLLPLILLSLALPNAALGQSATPGPSELAPEARAQLARAAGDSQLAPWQRGFMLRLAREGNAPAPDSAVTHARTTRLERTSDETDGAWAQLVVGTRAGHSAIYDPVRDRMVVFGGWDGNGSDLQDVWTLSLAGTPTWTRMTPTGTPPHAREYHNAIYDPVRDRMVMFGGNYYDGVSGGDFDDVWALSLAGAPAWTELTPTGTVPYTPDYHTAIYDPVRDRMVVCGGTYGNDEVWALSLAEPAGWTQLVTTGAPSTRWAEHSAIYDSARDRMVVFGGSHGNEVWAMSMTEPAAWTQLTPTGTPPNARSHHPAIYDPVRDRMIVFGGEQRDYPYAYNDAWSLSFAGTPAWTNLAPSGTPPHTRSYHSAIYDPVRDRMLVFGGYGYIADTQFLNDVWTLPLEGTPAWTDMTPAGSTPPSPRLDHSAIYDPVRDRMVVFGGENGFVGTTNDVWTLSQAGAAAWTKLTPAGTPPSPRSSQTAIYDPVRDRMVMFGGYENDSWALTLAGVPAWTPLVPTGTPPSARGYCSAIYDPGCDGMVMFGGNTWDGAAWFDVNDLWLLSLTGTPAWTQLLPTGTPPSARDGHSAIYDPVRNRMVVFGGYGTSLRNDVWALSLTGVPAWTELTPTGTPPSGRWGHSAIYDPVRDRMVVFGGDDGSSRNDAWALSLAGTPAWAQLAPSGIPLKMRFSHTAIYNPVHDRMVVFGGSSSSSDPSRNDVWSLGWNMTDGVEAGDVRPFISYLRPPAPNPTTGTTTVSFALAQAGRVQLGVYDVSGRLVRRLVDGERRAGVETVVWNGTAESGAKLGSGVYFVRLAAPGFRETRRVILLQ